MAVPSAATPLTLRRCLRVLEAQLRSFSADPEQLGAPVAGVIAYDPADPETFLEGQIVLAIGYDPGSEAFFELAERATRARATAVLVKEGPDRPEHSLPGAGPIPVLLLTRNADWGGVLAVLRGLTAHDGAASTSGVPLGDLFGLAHALAELAGGAVSLVDYLGRVVGYSTLPGQAIDDMRRQSTLALQEPTPPSENPTYRRVYQSVGALSFPGSAQQLPRVAIAIRADGEPLGAIWVIKTDVAEHPSTQAFLAAVEPLVALHMVHARQAGADSELRKTHLLRTLLEDPGHSSPASEQLGLVHGQPHTVIAFALRDHSRDPFVGPERRLLHLVRVSAETAFPRSASALLGSMVVLVGQGADDAAIGYFTARTVQLTSQAIGLRASAGIGRVAQTLPALGDSYRQAILALRTRQKPLAIGASAHEAAADSVSFDEVRTQLGLLAAGEAIRQGGYSDDDAITALLAEDERTDGPLSQTLLTFLNQHGSIRHTAEELRVHQNTVRYRLDRISADFGIRLDQPLDRLWAWLRLVTLGERALPRRHAEPGEPIA
ncbi:PucR family transcriptional regulator [Leucobacter sp. M11]|uniref:PucR family transcriptional regulator n=1 Tax=Leucobacter sp. M11 TaxID=2993565 RepID=UPI002D8058DE|nr:helix-turn-helix domain-containing protein [Leucobacter sp. M11]MEB4614227.1 helix-turn-helix domain-containing protein [Leucobacter sp. M11]